MQFAFLVFLSKFICILCMQSTSIKYIFYAILCECSCVVGERKIKHNRDMGEERGKAAEKRREIGEERREKREDRRGEKRREERRKVKRGKEKWKEKWEEKWEEMRDERWEMRRRSGARNSEMLKNNSDSNEMECIIYHLQFTSVMNLKLCMWF